MSVKTCHHIMTSELIYVQMYLDLAVMLQDS